MWPSGRTISQMTAASLKPASRARSTLPSVWPARTSTPPSRARRPLTWPLPRVRSSGPELVVDGDGDGAGAVIRRGAGGDAGAGVDRLREGSLLRIDIGAVHRRQVQPVADGRRHGQADDAAAIAHHEIDGLRRGILGGDDQVAFVLAVLVVDQHDHAPGLEIGEGFLDRAEILRVRHGTPRRMRLFASARVPEKGRRATSRIIILCRAVSSCLSSDVSRRLTGARGVARIACRST